MSLITTGQSLLGDALKRFTASGKKIKGITGRKGIGIEGLWKNLEARGENLTDNVLGAKVDDAASFLDEALDRYYNRGYTDFVAGVEKAYGQALSKDQLDLLQKGYKNTLKDTDLETWLKRRNTDADTEIQKFLNSKSFQNLQSAPEPITSPANNSTIVAPSKPIHPQANSNSVVAGDVEYNQKRLEAIRNYNAEMEATNAASIQRGTMAESEAGEGIIYHESQLPSMEDGWKTENGKTTKIAGIKSNYKNALQRNLTEYNYDNPEFDILNQSQSNQQSWGLTAKAVLGTAVGGAALCAALSSSRGQQNNAQLYGQQPLY